MANQDMQDFEKVVLAGMRIMYDQRTFEIFKRGLLRTDRPVPQRLAAEAAGLMKMLFDKSGGKMPKQIIAPAGAMLLMEMGKFMTEAGMEAVTPAQIKEGTVLLMKALTTMFAAGQQPAPQQPPAAQPAPAPTGGLMQAQGV